MQLTATNTRAPHAPHDDPPDIADLPAIVREFFALSARIQSLQGLDAMSAFYQAKLQRPAAYERIATAPPEELNAILASLDREKKNDAADADAA
jgi:hypothetical protein